VSAAGAERSEAEAVDTTARRGRPGRRSAEDNCQVALTVSWVNASVSLPSAYRLYLPESWAADRIRRRAAGVINDNYFCRSR